MPKVTINEQEIDVEAGMTVLQACEQAGVEIPRFCYHERLSIAGNCRMCLVEVSPGPPKPQASCALPVMEGQVIKTNSPMVDKARKGVMEFLLINHPLDCPICDQGGECDLQDQAVAYGSNLSRYKETKRAVTDKYMGPIVKTVMNRCIHCTRCVRFVTEVAGVDAIGLLNRGTYAEISALEQAVNSELSGNLVDLCPVGALTAKPYSYHARPWELTKTPSIDVSDALGSNIRIDSRGNEVMRILPRLNEDVNAEWISDKARHALDGLKTQRLDRPYLRNSKTGRLEPIEWEEALKIAAKKLSKTKAEKIGVISGDLVDVESLFALKLLMEGLKVRNLDCRQDGAYVPSKLTRAHYLFNPTITGIDEMDALLLVGSNPRHEAAVLNARVLQRMHSGQLKVGYIGAPVDLNYDYQNLGDNPTILDKLLTGRHEFSKILKNAKHPAIIVGQGALAREDGEGIYHRALKLSMQYKAVRENWCGFGVLPHHASWAGGLDIGFLPKASGLSTPQMMEAAKTGKLELIYLMGCDSLPMDHLKQSFVIYQGHHGDVGAHHADLILPGAAYTEKDATYVNLEGRVQQTNAAIAPLGQAKQDWAIIRALSDALGMPLPFDNLTELRQNLYKKHKFLARLDQSPEIGKMFDALVPIEELSPISSESFELPIKNFYQSDVISRASQVMAQCTAEFVLNQSARKVA